MSKQDDIGYGKPPVKHQFKKGKSGNLSGRRKRPREQPPLDPKKILIAELKSPITIKENGKKKKITAMEAIWKSIIAGTLKGDKTARKYVMDFMMKQDKYAFEDEGTKFFRTMEYGEIRITKEQQKEIDELLERAPKYAHFLDADSDQKQGNGSSSGEVGNQEQGNCSSAGGVDHQGQGNDSSSGGADNQKEGSGSSSGES